MKKFREQLLTGCLVYFVCSGVLLAASLPKVTPRNRLQQDVQSRHDALRTGFQADVARLIDEAQSQQLDQLARELASYQSIEVTTSPSYTRPPKTLAAPIPLTLPEHERALRQQFQTLQVEYAKALHNLAQLALRSNLASMTYRMLLETLRVSPDHAETRRILGYELYRQTWVTPFERKQIEDGKVDDPQFGWLPKEDVERYHNGERHFGTTMAGLPIKGGWIAADREAEMRRDFRFAWEIRTANFLVKTNHSLEKGVEISRALEDFHEYFRYLFAAFYNTPQQMQALFRAKSSGSIRDSQRYVVHYYASKDEYIRTLAGLIPQIAQTNGIYIQEHRVAYFFHNPDDPSLAPMYHEASHQLFYESQTKPRQPGKHAHFWIIEGIACYLESFERSADGQSFSSGNPEFIRFVNARQNLLRNNLFIPLEQLAALGQDGFQQPPILAMQQRYSQSSGLAHFFMHYGDGEFRDALINHIAQLYSTHPRVSEHPDSMERLTEVSYDELNQLYRHYCAEIDQKLAMEIRTTTPSIP